MITTLRQNFAIIRTKILDRIFHIIHDCFTCRRYSTKVQQQLIGRAFLQSGIGLLYLSL